MSFIHSFTSLCVESKRRTSSHHKYWALQSFPSNLKVVCLVYRPKSLPKLDFLCSPPEPSGGEGVGKLPGRGGGGRACNVSGFWTRGAEGRAGICEGTGLGAD